MLTPLLCPRAVSPFACANGQRFCDEGQSTKVIALKCSDTPRASTSVGIVESRGCRLAPHSLPRIRVPGPEKPATRRECGPFVRHRHRREPGSFVLAEAVRGRMVLGSSTRPRYSEP